MDARRGDGIGRLAIALVILVVATACGPAPDNFYTDPAPMPAANGDIARSFPTKFNLNQQVDQWTVLYRSTDAQGQPMLVSGAVVVPTAAWTGSGPRPIVALAPGTQGAGDACAPSKLMTTSGYYEIVVMEALLAEGYAVAVTDYQGLGTPGLPTYIIADPSAHALLDVARAAQRLPEAGLSPDAPIVVQGYSQGGQAAARAAEIEATYAPELNIKGAVAGGVPADLAGVGDFLNGDGRLFFFFLAMAAVGLSTAYPELDIDPYLNEAGRTLLQAGLETCVVGGLLLGLGGTIEEFTVTNPLDEPAWQNRIDQQLVGRVAPRVPTRLYHGVLDEVIPFQQGVGLRDRWCAAGAEVDWTGYELTEHLIGPFVALPDTVAWTKARFAGSGTTGTFCR